MQSRYVDDCLYYRFLPRYTLHSIFSNLVSYNVVILQFVLNAPFFVF